MVSDCCWNLLVAVGPCSHFEALLFHNNSMMAITEHKPLDSKLVNVDHLEDGNMMHPCPAFLVLMFAHRLF